VNASHAHDRGRDDDVKSSNCCACDGALDVLCAPYALDVPCENRRTAGEAEEAILPAEVGPNQVEAEVGH